ncbi:MAG: phosphodiester glycosidase family protein, partial [Gaiellaceae bacterium]
MSPAAAGAATTLVPGVTYDRLTHIVRGQPVVVHVVRAPRHGGLYQLRPVLSNNSVLGHQTVPSMQRGLRPWSTAVGVNGDFFNTASGSPSGAFLRDGVLSAKPNLRRSALAIAFDGRLLVDRFRFAASWKGGANEAHPVRELNRVIADPPGVSLFTRAYGAPTPRVRGAVELVLSGFPRALLNGWLRGRVTAVRRNGGTRVPPGGAVLQARGFWRKTMLREAPPGTNVTVRLQMLGLPDDSADAIGGGPVLVRDGAPVRQADENFTLSQLVPRHPRTAVGQLADGRLILVVADGRSRRSLGLTNWDMALTMANLGAVTAMGFDGGGSTTLSFDGRVLNRPSGGRARAVANGLMVQYYGIYAPRVPRSVLTPNRDGVGDTTVASAKIVRRSSVHLRLLRPN